MAKYTLYKLSVIGCDLYYIGITTATEGRFLGHAVGIQSAIRHPAYKPDTFYHRLARQIDQSKLKWGWDAGDIKRLCCFQLLRTSNSLIKIMKWEQNLLQESIEDHYCLNKRVRSTHPHAKSTDYAQV